MASLDLNRTSSATQAAPQSLGDAYASTEPPLPTVHTSLATSQEDMAGLLATVLQRQVERRVERPARARPSERPDAMFPAHKAELSRIRMMLQRDGTSFGGTYEHARAIFPDPEELALVLAGLREEHDFDTKVRAEIDRALASLIREHGHSRIATGLNTRQVVSEFSARMDVCPQALRRAYRTLAGATSGEGVTYRYLIDAFGFSRRGLVLDFLEQALAADVAADTPSHPPEQFQPLLALLFQLRLLRSADALLLASSRYRHPGKKKNAAESQEDDLFDQAVIDLLIASLSDIQEASRQFMHCLKRWQSFAGDGVLQWASRMLAAMADVPCELFPDLTYREALLTRLAEVADELFSPRRGAHARLRSIHG